MGSPPHWLSKSNYYGFNDEILDDEDIKDELQYLGQAVYTLQSEMRAIQEDVEQLTKMVRTLIVRGQIEGKRDG